MLAVPLEEKVERCWAVPGAGRLDRRDADARRPDGSERRKDSGQEGRRGRCGPDQAVRGHPRLRRVLLAADEALAVYDEKAFDKRIRTPSAAALLAELRHGARQRHELSTLLTWKLFSQRFVEQRGLGLGSIVHAVRVAVTGKAVGFGLFDILSILGPAERP